MTRQSKKNVTFWNPKFLGVYSFILIPIDLLCSCLMILRLDNLIPFYLKHIFFPFSSVYISLIPLCFLNFLTILYRLHWVYDALIVEKNL